MLITQKKQYALRAIYELAKRRESGPVKSAQIADAQAIPKRFLEIILNRLKHAGLVTSKRGYCGGFELKRPPQDITVKDVLMSMEDIDGATVCVSCISKADCKLYGSCAFLQVWQKMQKAFDHICHTTTIEALLDDDTVQQSV